MQTQALLHKSSRNSFAAFILLELAIIIIPVLLFEFSLQTIQTATRFSGRLSFVFFSLIILLKHRNVNWQSWISENPYLLFAILHGIHLVELSIYVLQSNNTLVPIRLLGGFVAYLLIFLMPVFNFMYGRGKISIKIFHRIEILFSTYVWFIFFMSYLPRALGKLPHVGGSHWEHVTFLSLVIMVGVASVTPHVKFRKHT
jgi:hypothetical protein